MNTRNRRLPPILIAINPPSAIDARNRHPLAIHRRRSPRPRIPPLQLHARKHILPHHQPGRASGAGDFKLENEPADEDGDHVPGNHNGCIEQADEQQSRKHYDAKDDMYGAHDCGEPVQRHGQDLRRRIPQRLVLLVRAEDKLRPRPAAEPRRQRIPPSRAVRLMLQFDASHHGRVVERPRREQMDDARQERPHERHEGEALPFQHGPQLELVRDPKDVEHG